MSILHIFLPLQKLPQNLSISSSRAFSDQTRLTFFPKFSHLSLRTTSKTSTVIRMGGGPRTFPGGVNKWQWKRMQAKKAKQLLKARLARERQIYEMRKRAELKAAISELERPWEIVEKAPKLFSTSADEQVQVLADRFQRPGGFDLWSEKDGPELFKTVDGLPSGRFFPKGVVHSIKPYGRVGDDTDEFGGSDSDLENVSKRGFSKKSLSGDNAEKINVSNEGRSGEGSKGKFRKKRNGRRMGLLNSSDTDNLLDSRRVGFDKGNSGSPRALRNDGSLSRGMGKREEEVVNSEVYDMSLQRDGLYWFQEEN